MLGARLSALQERAESELDERLAEHRDFQAEVIQQPDWGSAADGVDAAKGQDCRTRSD